MCPQSCPTWAVGHQAGRGQLTPTDAAPNPIWMCWRVCVSTGSAPGTVIDDGGTPGYGDGSHMCRWLLRRHWISRRPLVWDHWDGPPNGPDFSEKWSWDVITPGNVLWLSLSPQGKSLFLRLNIWYGRPWALQPDRLAKLCFCRLTAIRPWAEK